MICIKQGKYLHNSVFVINKVSELMGYIVLY